MVIDTQTDRQTDTHTHKTTTITLVHAHRELMNFGGITVILAVNTNTNANHTAAAPNKGYNKLCNYDSSEFIMANSSQDPANTDQLCSHNQQWFCFNSTAI